MNQKSIVAQIFLWLFVVVLLVGLAFGIYWVAKNIDTIKSGIDGTQIYTQEQYDANYDRGVLDGAVIKIEQDTLIINLKKQVDNLNAIQSNLKTDLATKNARISVLESSNTDLSAEKSNLLSEVTRLNALITNLQADINFYIAKIEELKTENEVFVQFVLDDAGSDVYYTKVLSKGETIAADSVTRPSDTEYKTFVGWSLDKVNVVTLDDSVITADTVFYAVWETHAFDVQFANYDATVLATEIVEKNGNVSTVPNSPSYGDINHAFAYWTPDNGVTKLYGWSDVHAYKITQDTTFVAVFKEIDPYMRVIVNGELAQYTDKDYVVESLAEKHLTTSQVYPVIALFFDNGGYTEIEETTHLDCYDIYITSTDSQVIINLNNKTYTYDKLDNPLTLYVEFKIISTGYKDDSVNFGYELYV